MNNEGSRNNFFTDITCSDFTFRENESRTAEKRKKKVSKRRRIDRITT